MPKHLTDFQQLTMIKNELSSIGLRDEEPWKCVKALIDSLMEYEEDIVILQKKLSQRASGIL